MTVGTYVRTITDGGPSGTTIGQSATDLVGFFGVTPVVQQAALTAIGTSTPVSGAFGFTSTQATAIITAINAIITELKALGLTA